MIIEKKIPTPARAQYAVAIALFLLALQVLPAHAQFFGGRGRRGGGMAYLNSQQQREQEQMEKAIDPAFKEDVFTFARLRFEADYQYGFGNGRSWNDDTPEADLCLTYRLFEATSLKIRPGLTYIGITTNELQNYPFVYVAGAGAFVVSDQEAATLRQYLLNGGFMMVDDFWGDDPWHHFYEQLKKIFPNREPVRINLDHPIFHTVYKFSKLPQIPSVGAYLSYGLPYDPERGWSFAELGHEPRYFAVYDDKQRMMMLICHNNHYGDGWEHETDNNDYFDTFSMPMAYPMLLNIVVYATTH